MEDVVKNELSDLNRKHTELIYRLQAVKEQIPVNDTIGGVLYAKLLDTVHKHFDEQFYPLNCKISVLEKVLEIMSVGTELMIVSQSGDNNAQS